MFLIFCYYLIKEKLLLAVTQSVPPVNKIVIYYILLKPHKYWRDIMSNYLQVGSEVARNVRQTNPSL